MTFFESSAATETTPARTFSCETGTPSCFDARPSRTARASAAAWRTCGPPAEIELEPAVKPWFGVTSVFQSPWLTCWIVRSSSSAAIISSPVGAPVISILPK